jgi:uncharacterized membrane protein YraQ (UPF0718 family)
VDSLLYLDITRVSIKVLWYMDVLLSGLTFLVQYLFMPHGAFSLARIATLTIAFALSGALAVFIAPATVISYLGSQRPKYISYSVAACSGVILAVCSCTVLPMFASIRRRGAGLGPAVTFLFSGPAVNLLAITMTMELIGFDLGVARIIAAVALSVVIGAIMAGVFRRSEEHSAAAFQSEPAREGAPTRATVGLLFVLLVAMLVVGMRQPVIIAVLAVAVVFLGYRAIPRADLLEWLRATVDLIRKIMPLFLAGVFVAGLLTTIVQPETLALLQVNENTIGANGIAAVLGATMYFATLTEVPIVNGLLEIGMHRGPALALLLAGPAVSIPNMIVIAKVMGVARTATYITLVVILSAAVGLVAGAMVFGL